MTSLKKTHLKVNEIFYSIQGESLYAGRPCAFVRLSGCNLRCAYCDTQYAYHDGTNLAIAEIIEAVQAYACPLVEVTGGEPLLQAGTPELIDQLLDLGMTVLLETNGSLDIRPVPAACIKIVDIKCPSSKEHEKNKVDNLDFLRPDDQVKFVIANRKDYLFAKDMAGRITTISPGNVLFSPAADLLAPDLLAEWMLADKLPYRLHLQLHKILWGKECRR